MFSQALIHIFSDHELRPVHLSAEVHQQPSEIWPSVYLLVCLSLLAFIKSRGINRVIRIIQSTFSSQVLQQLEREQGAFVKTYAVALNAFYVLNIAFLIFKLNRFFPYVLADSPQVAQYFFFLFLVTLLMSLKLLFNRMLALFTDAERLIGDYDTSSGLLNQTFGLFIFPWIVLAEFTDYSTPLFLYAACAVLGASIALKWYRGMMMSLVEERVGLLQIFSYFCGLEILPLFVVIKFVIETF